MARRQRRFFWNRRTREALIKAADYFRRAIGIDPAQAAACLGLADSYSLLADWEYGLLPPQNAFPKASAVVAEVRRLKGRSHERARPRVGGAPAAAPFIAL